ncbi:hypothetical protein [Streptomyces bacillaris]
MPRGAIPPHGSEARYKGTRNGSRPPCRCASCVRGNRLAGIRRERVRLAGGSNLIPVPVLATHINTLIDSGMSQCGIARIAGVSQSTISNIVAGKLRSCLRSKGERILAVRPATIDDQSNKPALGSARRLQALYAIGHGGTAIAARFDIHRSTVGQIINGRYGEVNGFIAVQVREIYAAMSGSPGSSVNALRRARQEGWAPPAAWDDNRLDDPQARPEWTGYCGTDRGWWSHRQQNIPVCAACDQAHTQWKADHAHLPRTEFMHRLNASRASASSRGVAVAQDGRELLAQGYSHEQAAARLGISTDYLHAELRRHPAPGESEAA